MTWVLTRQAALSWFHALSGADIFFPMFIVGAELGQDGAGPTSRHVHAVTYRPSRTGRNVPVVTYRPSRTGRQVQAVIYNILDTPARLNNLTR